MSIDVLLREWSQATYAAIHALRLMKAVDLGNVGKVGYSVQQSLTWLASDLGYESNVPERPFSPESISLGREAEEVLFTKVAGSIANTLLLTLVSLMDEALDEILRGRGLKPRRYPTQKLAQLEKALPKTLLRDNRWAFAGAREAIILRNVLVHSSGTWNAESIEQLRSLVAKTPPTGEDAPDLLRRSLPLQASGPHDTEPGPAIEPIHPASGTPSNPSDLKGCARVHGRCKRLKEEPHRPRPRAIVA